MPPRSAPPSSQLSSRLSSRSMPSPTGVVLLLWFSCRRLIDHRCFAVVVPAAPVCRRLDAASSSIPSRCGLLPANANLASGISSTVAVAVAVGHYSAPSSSSPCCCGPDAAGRRRRRRHLHRPCSETPSRLRRVNAPLFVTAASTSLPRSCHHRDLALRNIIFLKRIWCLTAIENARGIMEVLAEMLNALGPGNKEEVKQDVIVDLVKKCRTYKLRVVHLVNSTTDESLLCQ